MEKFTEDVHRHGRCRYRILTRGGQENFSEKSANPKFLGLSQIRKFLMCASPRNANPEISTKYCTTLSLKVLKVVFLKRFFYFVL